MLHNAGHEKARYSALQNLEFSHRGKLLDADMPMIYVPPDGVSAGEAYLVLRTPHHEGSEQWVALDSLNRDGELFAVPGYTPVNLSCGAIRSLNIDQLASPEVAELLLSFCR